MQFLILFFLFLYFLNILYIFLFLLLFFSFKFIKKICIFSNETYNFRNGLLFLIYLILNRKIPIIKNVKNDHLCSLSFYENDAELIEKTAVEQINYILNNMQN